jgi:hypothetical protein
MGSAGYSDNGVIAKQYCGEPGEAVRAGSVMAASTHVLVGRRLRCEPRALASLSLYFVLFLTLNHFVVLPGFRSRLLAAQYRGRGPRRGRRTGTHNPS